MLASSPMVSRVGNTPSSTETFGAGSNIEKQYRENLFVAKCSPKVLAKEARRRERVKSDPVRMAAKQEYQREYGRTNRAKLNEADKARYQRNKIKIRLQRKGINPNPELIAHLENHSGFCDICSAPGDGRWKELSIDHCHDTGAFRGMLCSSCNRAIGLFKDNPETMAKAIQYLNDQYRKTLPGEFIPG